METWLRSFVKWFCSKRGSSPNLMQMASHDMPARAGRKNGKVAKKKAKPKQLPSDDDRVDVYRKSFLLLYKSVHFWVNFFSSRLLKCPDHFSSM